jgi:predicted nucleic acid-binding protein
VIDAFVDTDVIVRFITGDDPVKTAAAGRLFTAVENKQISLYCPVTVIADALYVLTSRNLYGIDRRVAVESLSALVDLPGIHIAGKPVVRVALDLFASTRVDFGDAMLVAEMAATDIPTLYSFDADFDRFSSVKRVEPR